MARKPNLSIETIRREIAADDAARRERSNAKRRERAAAKKAEAAAVKEVALAEAAVRHNMRDIAAEHRAALVTLREDFDVYHARPDCDPDLTFEAYLAENGYNADGSPMPVDDEPPAAVPKTSKAQYVGPMLALRSAAKTYVKGANGNPHCNDPVAALLAGVSREATVLALGSLLFVKGVTTSVNPYSKLNPGQQSMNLRNKLRGAMKNGFVTLEDIKQALVTHAPKA